MAQLNAALAPHRHVYRRLWRRRQQLASAGKPVRFVEQKAIPVVQEIRSVLGRYCQDQDAIRETLNTILARERAAVDAEPLRDRSGSLST